MKTYLDIGNSYIKAARKSGLEWNHIFREKIVEEDHFFRWLDSEAIDFLIACSVVEKITTRLKTEFDSGKLKLLTPKDIPADYLSYETPLTLGMDRFLTCYGALSQVTESVVVIDAGSACTIDLMTADRTFQGGVIMPGLEAVRSVISEKLPALPVPDDRIPENWPGKSTDESLQWGTIGAFLESIVGFLKKFRHKYGEFDLFLTGGSAPVLARYLQSEFSPRIRPHLLFEGMEVFENQMSE